MTLTPAQRRAILDAVITVGIIVWLFASLSITPRQVGQTLATNYQLQCLAYTTNLTLSITAWLRALNRR